MKLNDLFFDSLPIIKLAAPTVAGAIGGPIGIAVGYVIPILARAFDAHPEDVKGLVANILSDPEATNKLKSIEDDYGDWISTLQSSVTHLSSAEINIKLEWKNTDKQL